MTTLSKEDVVRIMEKSGFNSWVSGEGKSNEEFCMELATLARADLVAENERLRVDLNVGRLTPGKDGSDDK